MALKALSDDISKLKKTFVVATTNITHSNKETVIPRSSGNSVNQKQITLASFKYYVI